MWGPDGDLVYDSLFSITDAAGRRGMDFQVPVLIAKVEVTFDPVETQAARAEFSCPRCGAVAWRAELFMPGGLTVTCNECEWSKPVSEIDAGLT